ncbi:transforming growth factor beta receptor type 3 isoform X2 [Thalassophryne amazonica]|uniref:transforming growth factor beta receptor type 3 isoform X2 n=1 Tax=Thalassophryne amazonica TaxID=390379 RepID=UPI001470A26E|nr:transforming growth factor beta receptor type 3 isoform X2 [Thalassophryne amazonica]
MDPIEAQHPVQGLLERFEAGPGCTARETGNKETHVIAVGRVTSSSKNKVVVLLKPLTSSSSQHRLVYLLLSSQVPLQWWLEAEDLPADLSVLVQLASNSSIQSHTLRVEVQSLNFLPFHPRALHRWALKHHGTLSSLTHTSHGNRVYVHVGEDPTLPTVCLLQSMLFSRNYMTSDLQPQTVQGCSHATAGGKSPEVHVIKLHSAGAAFCGSLQVEVIVSLLPPVANRKTQKVVLILSSSVPVNWAVVAHGVQGHISVHSSNSVSSPSPSEPHLTLSSTLNSDLSSIPDLLVWARESGYTEVTSYTEADLANRFVVQLTGAGTDVLTVMSPLAVRPPGAEELRLRQWLNIGEGGGGPQSFTVQCNDGRLNVTLDQHILQNLSVPVSAVTLQDPACQAQSNGTHFLLVFPVISCETEAVLLDQPRGVQYKNTILFWRDNPQTILDLNETKSESPFGIHISCLAPVHRHHSSTGDGNTPTEFTTWTSEDPGPNPGPKRRPGLLLLLKLFVSESYEEKRIGPCVITANERVYVELSAKGPSADGVEVKSCVVSPLSDPKKSPFWMVIKEGCSSDVSLTLSPQAEDRHHDGKLEEEEDKSNDHNHLRYTGGGLRIEEGSAATRAEKEIKSLRFSFILRSVYNDSMQFLHCSILLCTSDSTRGESMKGTVKNECHDGLRIPPLATRSPRHQCEIRNLSRPMVVTQPTRSIIPKLLRPPAGQRTKRLSVSPLASQHPEQISSMVGTGPMMGIVFGAFVMGVSLMAGLWCICTYTRPRPEPTGGNGHLVLQNHDGFWNDQSTSSV